MTKLDVSKNYLDSTIGSEVGYLYNLVSLRLHDNYRTDDETDSIESYGIRGPIPSSLGNLNLLQELRLDNNYVSGALPPALGNLQNLVTLRLESNNLESTIPSTLGNLPK